MIRWLEKIEWQSFNMTYKITLILKNEISWEDRMSWSNNIIYKIISNRLTWENRIAWNNNVFYEIM